MKEIKFRAWCVAEKYWDDQILKTRPLDTIIQCNTHILVQYTGINDKNGKEIYEGDILERIGSFGIFSKIVVGWNENECCFIYKSVNNLHGEGNPLHNNFVNLCDWTYWAVCGNIYENPELLAN